MWRLILSLLFPEAWDDLGEEVRGGFGGDWKALSWEDEGVGLTGSVLLD